MARKNADRPGPGRCVWLGAMVSLDRRGRLVEDLITIVDRLKREQVGFQSLHEQLDTTTAGGMFVFHVFAPMAKFLRTIIVANTNEGHRPTIELWGVGPRISARLARHGIGTVAELAGADLAVLVGEFGPRMGTWYADLGRGHGSAVVDDTPWVARGHGRERTFQRDLTCPPRSPRRPARSPR
jgi:Resolvase, N terminal domain